MLYFCWGTGNHYCTCELISGCNGHQFDRYCQWQVLEWTWHHRECVVINWKGSLLVRKVCFLYLLNINAQYLTFLYLLPIPKRTLITSGNRTEKILFLLTANWGLPCYWRLCKYQTRNSAVIKSKRTVSVNVFLIYDFILFLATFENFHYFSRRYIYIKMTKSNSEVTF